MALTKQNYREVLDHEKEELERSKKNLVDHLEWCKEPKGCHTCTTRKIAFVVAEGHFLRLVRLGIRKGWV